MSRLKVYSRYTYGFNAYSLRYVFTNLLLGTVTTALDFGLKILSGERLELNLIDENGKQGRERRDEGRQRY
jgi:hypothetical protein